MSRHDAAAANADAKSARSGRRAPQPVKSRNRSPSMNRYVDERRWEKNRTRRVRRHLKRHPLDAQAWYELLGPNEKKSVFPLQNAKHMRVPRGTARAQRRVGMTQKTEVPPCSAQ